MADHEEQAQKEIAQILGVSRIENEGHTSEGDLLCYFSIPKNKIPSLANKINKRVGGGEDIIYLSNGGVVDSFSIVEKPGISCPVPFEDWEEYIIYI
jgi:hypothetical protein